VRCASSGIHYKLQLCSSLLLYIVCMLTLLHYHPFLVTNIKLCAPFYSFTLSLSPTMLSQSVRCASSSIQYKLQLYSCLLLYIIPESQHVDPVCELCLNYLPYLVTTINTVCVLHFTLLPCPWVQAVHEMCCKWHSFQVTTVLQFVLVHCPWVPPCLWSVPPLTSIHCTK